MMVVLVVADTSCTGWQGVLSDGYLDQDALSELAERTRGMHPHDKIDGLFLELAVNANQAYRRGIKTCATRRGTGDCDLWVLKPSALCADDSRLAPISAELEAETHPGYRILVLTAADCPAQERCARYVMERLKFQPKDEAEYKNLSGFVEASEALVEAMLEPYVAPCMVVERTLSRLGISSSYESL